MVCTSVFATLIGDACIMFATLIGDAYHVCKGFRFFCVAFLELCETASQQSGFFVFFSEEDNDIR